MLLKKKKDICIEFEYKSIQNCIHLQIFWAPHIYLSRTDVAVLEKKSMPPKTAPKGKAKAKPGNIFMYVYVCINLHVCVCVRIYLNLNLYIYMYIYIYITGPKAKASILKKQGKKAAEEKEQDVETPGRYTL